VTQAVADRHTDGRMDRHCATIRASLACASRANRHTAVLVHLDTGGKLLLTGWTHTARNTKRKTYVQTDTQTHTQAGRRGTQTAVVYLIVGKSFRQAGQTYTGGHKQTEK